jgi:hypothetical protein
MQRVGERTRRKGVADGKSGEAMDFIEGAENEDVCAFADERYGGAVFKVAGVFEVGLIYDDRRVLGDFAEEAFERYAAANGSGWIVWIDEIECTSICVDLCGERSQVVFVFLVEWDGDADAADA